MNNEVKEEILKIKEELFKLNDLFMDIIEELKINSKMKIEDKNYKIHVMDVECEEIVVEKFYEWNVEEKSFKGEIPKIEGMNLVDNLMAYIERKLFTLNTGHATTAYIGNLKGYSTIKIY